jgi:A1 cistron-splicing factor AAR2
LGKGIEQATIRGIYFWDGSYEAGSKKVEKECKAQAVQLTSNDHHVLMGQDKYLGGMASPCGRFIYGVPGKLEMAWRTCCRRQDHRILNNSDQVLVIDCQKSIVYTIGDSDILKSGRHRITQDGRYKYLGGALTNDGRYAYLFPCDAERVLRIDCHTEELSLVGHCFLGGVNKFQNGFCGRDGYMYGIPQRAIGVLRVTPGG